MKSKSVCDQMTSTCYTLPVPVLNTPVSHTVSNEYVEFRVPLNTQ